MGCTYSACITKKSDDENSNSSEINIQMSDTQEIEWKDTIEFIPPVTEGICIKVYDGDTITIATRLPIKDCPLYRFPVRLHGIDTPEIKGKDDDEKECAVNAREFLKDKILNKRVILKNNKKEKFGRLLCDVYLDDCHLNNEMIVNRYALKYDGGTKERPVSWMKYHLTGSMD